MEVNLKIPGIKDYNEDILLLVIPTMTYSKKVPVIVGTKIIDRAMGIIIKGELAKATMSWKQAHFGGVMSGLLQLPCKSIRGDRGAARGLPPLSLPTLLCLRNSLWTISRSMSMPHGGSPFPHLGLAT